MSILSALANHLWQSTLFAGAMWVLAIALRKNSAAVRYGVWMAASVKFLIPFALLVSLGSHLGWRSPAIVQAPAMQMAEQIGHPFDLDPEIVSPRTHTEAAVPPAFSLWKWVGQRLPEILLTVWFGGFFLGVGAWLRWSWKMRELGRMGTPMELGLPVRVLSSRMKMEPCVFGIFKPVLLLPEGIAEQLTQEQLDTVVAHEWKHIQRRDNLTAALHMAAETVFWFYPALRWIRVRMMEERERACDEAVLRQGNEPEVYAESILKVCKFYLAAQPGAAGVSGSNLRRRIEVIVDYREALRMSLAKKMLLASVAVVAVGVPVMLGQVKAAQAGSETELVHPVDPMPAYEVATIKPWDGKGFGRPLRLYIQNAFGIESTSTQRLIGPDWIDKKAWVVVGKPPAALQESMQKMKNDDQTMVYRRMQQSLLADRFKLKMHFETREMQIFELVPAKGGVKLKLAENQDVDGAAAMGPQGQLTQLKARSSPMRYILAMLSTDADFGGVPVVDKTELTGKYDLTLEWLPSYLPRLGVPGTMMQPWTPGPPPSADAVGPSLSAALEEVGLKLVRSKGPVEVVVIDHVEMPSEN